MFIQNIDQRTKVLNVLKTWGTDSLSYFHLKDERLYFFSPTGQSFLSYKIYNRVALVNSDPTGPLNERVILLQTFIQYMKSWKLKVCFISISQECKDILVELNFKAKRIGEEANINLDSFERAKLKKKVKRAVRYIENQGIEILFYSPSNIPSYFLDRLKEISSQWLMSKGKKEKGYSMTLGRLPNKDENDCVIAVAFKKNKIIGYCTFTPIYLKSGFSLDMIRKKKNAPNGLNEFLIIKSLEYFKMRNIKLVSLNFATFVYSTKPLTRFKSLITKLLAAFFKCNTLFSFNNKFHPEWKSRYISYAHSKDLPLSLLAIIRAER